MQACLYQSHGHFFFMNFKKVVREVMDLHLNLQAAQKGYENV
jgi:hypothetical protein